MGLVSVVLKANWTRSQEEGLCLHSNLLVGGVSGFSDITRPVVLQGNTIRVLKMEERVENLYQPEAANHYRRKRAGEAKEEVKGVEKEDERRRGRRSKKRAG